MTKSAEADVQYMERCIELAQQAREAGETAVGSLLVRDGQILGEGAESTRAKLDPAAHAEIEAIRATRIERVVIGTSAGEVGAVGSAHAFLGDSSFKKWGSPPAITSGVLEAEAAALLAK